MINRLISLPLTVLFLCSALLLAGCISIPELPTIPKPPTIPPPADLSDDTVEYVDEQGCFPVDCNLPPGMKELCQGYQAGTISWPADCAEMPGEACQSLCAQEKTASGVDLPSTVINGYHVGWMQPIQLDENFEDSGRPQFGWGLVTPVVDRDGKVLLVYGGLVEGTPAYYRYWNGISLTEPAVWKGPEGVQLRVFDSQNRLHIISMENMGQADRYLAHTTWDGTTFASEPIFSGQLVQPAILMNNLAIDSQDRLHLAFWDKSRGVR